jgi:tetratricopeptide (TPR) repeat protein
MEPEASRPRGRSSSASRPGPAPRARRLHIGQLAAVVVVLLAGSLLLLPRRFLRAPSGGTASETVSLPDAPTAGEQSLLRAVDTAPAGDPLPARRLGDFYLEAARPFEALWAYSQAAHIRPADGLSALGLARALEAGLLYDVAMLRLRALLAREKDRTSLRGPGPSEAGAGGEASARLAELLLRTGRPDAAISLLERAGAPPRTRSATGTSLDLLAGRAREAVGDAVGAERVYRRAAERDGRDGSAWRRLGLLALSEGRLDDARQAFERARSLDPTEPRTLVDLGRAHAASRTPAGREAAMRLYREAVGTRLYAPAFYESGLLLLEEKRLPQAAQGFGRATAADRDDADAYRELARVLDRLGRRAEAHYQRGLYYSVKDLRVHSMREYLAMAAADPARPDGLLMASQSEFKMQHTDRATALARRATERFPGNAAAREQLAALLVRGADRQAAKRACQAWLHEQPGAAQPLWLLGRVAKDELRFDDSIRYHEQALAKQPDNPIFLESLGDTLLAAPGAEHLPRVVATLSRAVALAPEDAKARYELGVALMRTGRPAEAQRQLLRSLDVDPYRGDTYNLLVQLARRLRQPGPASLFGPIVRTVEERLRVELSLWRHTWDEPQDPAGYLALAHFLVRTADLRKAESQLEEALVLRPHWPAAEAELARVRRLLAVQ